MWELPAPVLAGSAGLIIGVILGAAARMGDFCTLGAIESAAYGGDQRRARVWGVVLGVAILVLFGAEALGLAEITLSPYHQIAFNPFAAVFGGFVFGYGMALAGNCGFGALIRLGGGDLRSFLIVMIMAIAGFITLAGPLSPMRAALFPEVETAIPQGFAHAFARMTDLPPLLFAAPIGVLLIWIGIRHPDLRSSRATIGWSVIVGLAIAAAFIVTTWLHRATLDAIPVEGFTFTVPLGRAILYLMTASAGGLNFAVGSVVGVVLGAALAAAWRRRFRWEACEDPRELGRQVAGATMMGVGGVIAMGCSVGQGASAMATLSYSAPVVFLSIVVGALIGLRQLLRGFQSV
ncbi:MAG: YeeE/YedE family protein [Rhodobacteraceae bacterium]|nr:YeeE/YedE family protein [Paracoccaceae bacterium]